MSTLIGAGFVLIASTCSSLSTSFQKMAHRQTQFKDPRTQKMPRDHPLNTPIYCRGYFILGMAISLAAIACDVMSLMFIGTTLIGVLGCFSIPINIIVNRILLYEEILCRETVYIFIITIGCILSIITAKKHEPVETFIRFSEINTAYIGHWSGYLYGLSLGFFLLEVEGERNRSNAYYYIVKAVGVSGITFITSYTLVQYSQQFPLESHYHIDVHKYPRMGCCSLSFNYDGSRKNEFTC